MTRRKLDDGTLLGVLQEHAPRAMHGMEVVAALGLGPAARHEVSEALERMAEKGLVHLLPGGRYRLPKDVGTRVQGRFVQHPRGFAFIEANDGRGDVFVPPTGVLGAMHGDLVEAVAHPGPRGRDGLVCEVLQRRAATVPCTLRSRAAGAWAEPDDPRVRGPIVVTDVGNARDGESVVVTIERWPAFSGENPAGRVSLVLGAAGTLAVEVQKVLLREGIDVPPPEAVEAELARLPQVVEAEHWTGRRDLRDELLATIDPDDARDHDDAVCVRARPGGGWDVIVAIADVSSYVTTGSALDAMASTRGTSVYLPDRAIAMLPREISGRIASLLPGEDRLCLAVFAEVGGDGAVRSVDFAEAVMRSQARLTYGGVAAAMGWTTEGTPAPLTPALHEGIVEADKCAAVLRARRMRRGAMDFDLPEGRVRFADDGVTPVDIVQSRRDPGVRRAYALIEDLMLLANEAVAAHCVANGLGAIYRDHGGPQGEAFQRFLAAAQTLGHPVELDDLRDAPAVLSRFLRELQGKPEARVLGMLLLRAMPQARYSEQVATHHGLAAEAYLHFTSPIRRYPDLLVHRELRRALRARPGERPPSPDTLAAVAADCSRLERRAVEVEREVLDLYRCEVARKHVGERFEATVNGFSASSVYLDLDAPFLTVVVPVESVSSGAWDTDDLGLRIRSSRTGMTFEVGQVVAVEISEVSMARRSVLARLAPDAREALRLRAPRQTRDAKSFDPRATKKAAKQAAKSAKRAVKKGRRR